MITKFTEVERAEICDLANETLLKETTEDTLEALKYLTDVRGISLEVLKKFRFGYIPKRVGHDWSERIIMPLYDSHDNLIVLTSRKFRTTDHKQRPHLHEQFDKKRFLYGIQAAKRSILNWNAVVLVEGQFDTCRLHTNGLINTVGVLGSAFTFDHVCQLRRYCSNFYLAFDRDKSGWQNIIRAMRMYDEKSLATFDVNFIPVRLPQGIKDPDDFISNHGVKAFNRLLKESKELASSYKEREWHGITTETAA
tara:strand:+ start:62814 stop:63569 length:756 start_codon:yes stop_codon:yes gene_type:complete